MLSSILKNRNKSILQFFTIHVVITVVCSTLMLGAIGGSRAINFLIGQFYVWVSLWSISLSVYFFFLKKNIALLVGVIVFKWPILIYMVYILTKSVSAKPVFLALGFIPIAVSSLIWAVLQKE